MQPLLTKLEAPQRKAKLPQIRPGDTVRVHQTIREGNKKRTQIFEGVVIRLSRPNQLQARVVVRKITSGVGVEKSWLLHSPNVTKIEVIKRTRVRRAYLTYLRARRGKSARLAELGFDRAAANQADERTLAEVAAAEAEVKALASDSKKDQPKDSAKDQPSDAQSAIDDAADVLTDVDDTKDKTTDAIDSVEVVESTEDLARDENQQAAQADPDHDSDESMQGGADEDDAQIADIEAEKEGVKRAEDETDRAQNDTSQKNKPSDDIAEG